MAPSRALLSRNVRPIAVREDEEDKGSDDELAVGDTLSQDEDDLSAGSGGEMEAVDTDEEGFEGSEAEVQLGSVSFGALKQAQDSLARKRKRGSDETDEQKEKLEVLRARLRELREKKGVAADVTASKPRRSDVKAATAESEELDDNSDSDSAPSEQGARSKHAPMAQSSKHQVTRKRQVIDLPNRKVRDPRFDALNSHAAHPGDNTEKAYAFLRDYQASEIADLKAALKRTTEPDAKDKLKTTIGAMENRLRSKAAKEREQEVVRQHRREEKAKVEQGKTPYYLKRTELKERVQVKRFEGMKGKEREKVVEKKRKREDQREKRRMPRARRNVYINVFGRQHQPAHRSALRSRLLHGKIAEIKCEDYKEGALDCLCAEVNSTKPQNRTEERHFSDLRLAHFQACAQTFTPKLHAESFERRFAPQKLAPLQKAINPRFAPQKLAPLQKAINPCVLTASRSDYYNRTIATITPANHRSTKTLDLNMSRWPSVQQQQDILARILDPETRAAELRETSGIHFLEAKSLGGAPARKYMYLGYSGAEVRKPETADKWYGLPAVGPQGGHTMRRFQMSVMDDGSTVAREGALPKRFNWAHFTMELAFFDAESAKKSAEELALTPSLMQIYGPTIKSTAGKWMADLWAHTTQEYLPFRSDSGNTASILPPKCVRELMESMGTLVTYYADEELRIMALRPKPMAIARRSSRKRVQSEPALSGPEDAGPKKSQKRRRIMATPTQALHESDDASNSGATAVESQTQADMATTSMPAMRASADALELAPQIRDSSSAPAQQISNTGVERNLKQEPVDISDNGDESITTLPDGEIGEDWDSFLHGTWCGELSNDDALQRVIADYCSSTGETIVVPDAATLRVAWRQRAQNQRVDETGAWVHMERTCKRRQAATIAAIRPQPFVRTERQARVKIEKGDVVDLTGDD